MSTHACTIVHGLQHNVTSDCKSMQLHVITYNITYHLAWCGVVKDSINSPHLSQGCAKGHQVAKQVHPGVQLNGREHTTAHFPTASTLAIAPDIYFENYFVVVPTERYGEDFKTSCGAITSHFGASLY